VSKKVQGARRRRGLLPAGGGDDWDVGVGVERGRLVAPVWVLVRCLALLGTTVPTLGNTPLSNMSQRT
jgi:hypothetical protein